MEITTKNNRTLIFKEFADENIWESKPEIDFKGDFEIPNYQFSFKKKIISKKYLNEDYDFNTYLVNFINKFIENEEKILRISRKVLDDILNISGDYIHKHNTENSPLGCVHILDIVSYSFKLDFSTAYGYETYTITYLFYPNGDLTITKIKRKLCY